MLPVEQPLKPDSRLPGGGRWSSPGLPSVGLLLLGIACLISSASLWWQWTKVRSRESVLEVRTLTIRTPIDGVITTLNVSTGQTVRPQQLLFSAENTRVPKPRVGDLRIQLTAAKARLVVLEQKQQRARLLLGEARRDTDRQSSLQVARHQQELLALRRRRLKAHEESDFLKRDLERKRHLYATGAISYDQVDRVATSWSQEQEEIRSLDNQIRAQQSILTAARNNLTLIATRGGADPEARLRDERQRLAASGDDMQAQRRQIAMLQQQMQAAEAEHRLFTSARVLSPIDGVVWNVEAYVGSSVQRQASVLQLLDCRQRWMNTYVRERDLRNLRIGQPAEISLYGSDQKLTGTIDLIRSGIGRSSSGSDHAPLLPINIYREAQVRVRIDSDHTPADDPQRLCYSGYTGKVTFLTQSPRH